MPAIPGRVQGRVQGCAHQWACIRGRVHQLQPGARGAERGEGEQTSRAAHGAGVEGAPTASVAAAEGGMRAAR
eukprot:scaffold11625_cov123-Isochrysis_galbana.AAC.9